MTRMYLGHFNSKKIQRDSHLSDGGERQLEQEVEAVDDAHVASLHRREVLKHKVPNLQRNQTTIEY